MLVSREDFCRDGVDGLQKVVCVGAVLAQDQFQAVESFDEIGTVKYLAVFPDRVVELVQQHFILCHTEGAFQFGGVFYLKKGYIVEAVLQSEIQVFHVGSQMVGGFPACVTEKIEKNFSTMAGRLSSSSFMFRRSLSMRAQAPCIFSVR